ncbi:hypothetical protein J3Q64DRAFT_1767933 [Phycomyces blakesleeanus]|uniref:FAD dependent oxidoreductase domain-containing protein n=1 Tax=Phycomyces blakesleeanus TaxID=4837 RepID=A0ABR3ALR8_PHYBL
MPGVVVLGAGVSGLTTAIMLLRNGHKNVVVVGKHIPGDMSHEYTSPWAGASVLSFATSTDKRLQAIDRYTLKEFKRLANEDFSAGVMYCPGLQYNDLPDMPGQDSLWVRDHYAEFKEIPKDLLPEGTAFGFRFVSFTTSVPTYLAWLVRTLESLGGRLERGSFESLQEVMEKYKDADTLINCTAMGARDLKDVLDDNMYTLRGQTVLVRAPHVKQQFYRDGDGYFTYIIPRADGNVICGGTMDLVNKDPKPDAELTKTILKNCCNLYPDITHGKGPEAFDIVSVNVGFRPGRKGGIRIEKESRYLPNGKKYTVCHNYGHSSHGYQSSWGSSALVVKLLNDKTGLLSKL